VEDDDDLVRRLAVKALGEIGAEAEMAPPFLLGALKDHKQLRGIYAVDALGKIGPEAREVIPALADLLKSPDSGSATLPARLWPQCKILKA